MHPKNCTCWNCKKWQKDEAERSPVERIVIRQLLEGEIRSVDKSIERYVKKEAYDAAAHDSARREGIAWALFVLSEKLGV